MYCIYCIELCFGEFDRISLFEPSQYDVKNDCLDTLFHVCDFFGSNNLNEICDMMLFFQEMLNRELPVIIVNALEKLIKFDLSITFFF